MFIVNIEYPGTWLELPDKDKAFEVKNLISSMDLAIIDMAIALTMFIDCQHRELEGYASESHRNLWEQDRQLRMRIEQDYRRGLASEYDFYSEHEHHRLETEKLYRQEKLKAGNIPKSYKHRFPFIHAHSFLSSADAFYKYLSVLYEETELEHVAFIKQQLENELPTLSKIRNSAQHSEDRSRGYGKPADVRKKIKMDLKPIDNSFIKAEGGGVLVLSNLNGNKLGYTIDDGSYQEFEISKNTLDLIAESFQKLVNGFQWTGSPELRPYI
ncbi:hypothetical protein [Aeromonas sp. QDB03]|uniref:hypothetical protein n=1 Tax=Aeromonas sp. QDB03 TaxID=2989839 RepID=UPI0022DFB440|nr:hypothetical protein [Aeromonas sp. QDB03]